MTELYLDFLAQSAARDTAYTLLALFGSGLVLNGLMLSWMLKLFIPDKTVDLLLKVYAGGVLVLHLAGLVILPLVNLD